MDFLDKRISKSPILITGNGMIQRNSGNYTKPNGSKLDNSNTNGVTGPSLSLQVDENVIYKNYDEIKNFKVDEENKQESKGCVQQINDNCRVF